jgi:hypothetical protein
MEIAQGEKPGEYAEDAGLMRRTRIPSSAEKKNLAATLFFRYYFDVPIRTNASRGRPNLTTPQKVGSGLK